ncbi:MAG: hypothetical protein WBM50_11380, partial [Acidimicrobiales bacterium]
PQLRPPTPVSEWAQAALDQPPARPGLQTTAAGSSQTPSLPPLVRPAWPATPSTLDPATGGAWTMESGGPSSRSTAPTWTAPQPPPAAALPPSNLEQALPTGEAFESGVASLLTPQPGPATDGRGPDATASGLVKRRRGASQVPIGEGRRVAGAGRDPEEVRDRLSRYREGLKGKKPDTPGGSQSSHPGPNDTGDR